MEFETTYSSERGISPTSSYASEPVNVDTSSQSDASQHSIDENKNAHTNESKADELVSEKDNPQNKGNYTNSESKTTDQAQNLEIEKKPETQLRDKELDYYKSLAESEGYNIKLENKRYIHARQMEMESINNHINILEKYTRSLNFPGSDALKVQYQNAILNNDASSAQSIMNQLMRGLDSQSIFNLSRDLAASQQYYDKTLADINSSIHQEYLSEIDALKNNFMHENSDFFANTVNKEVVDIYFNEDIDDPYFVKELIEKVRKDERAVVEKELELHKENEVQKSKLRTLKDIDSAGKPLIPQNYTINDIINLSDEEFKAWANS